MTNLEFLAEYIGKSVAKTLGEQMVGSYAESLAKQSLGELLKDFGIDDNELNQSSTNITASRCPPSDLVASRCPPRDLVASRCPPSDLVASRCPPRDLVASRCPPGTLTGVRVSDDQLRAMKELAKRIGRDVGSKLLSDLGGVVAKETLRFSLDDLPIDPDDLDQLAGEIVSASQTSKDDVQPETNSDSGELDPQITDE